MLVIFIRLPPGSNPGAFILARFGLFAKLDLLPDGTCKIVLWFKGNDLHPGVAPTVHPSVRKEGLAQLAEQINSVKPVNRVVYVCYPSQDLCHRDVPMMDYDRTLNSSGPSNNFHWYSSQGSPALGSVEDCRTRLRWDSEMDWWNKAVMRREKPRFPPETTEVEELDEESGETILVSRTFPHPSFPFLEHGVLHYNPWDNQEFFAEMQAAWVRHHVRSDDYYLSMTKYQYRFGQAQAQQEYLENQSNGVVTITNMIQGLAIIVKPVQPNQASLSGSGAVPSSYPAVRTNDNRGKRKTSNDLTSEHRSKQPRADKEHLAESSQEASRAPSPSSHSMSAREGPLSSAGRRPFDPEGESEVEGKDDDEEDDDEEELEVPSYEVAMIVGHEVENGKTRYNV
ncbi:hypothetical protein PM082_020810 [Marasmius tenuissimus]|nr:hypothetical protein PM082_020810 [Marasmius tenuissimus]